MAQRKTHPILQLKFIGSFLVSLNGGFCRFPIQKILLASLESFAKVLNIVKKLLKTMKFRHQDLISIKEYAVHCIDVCSIQATIKKGLEICLNI